MVTAASGRGKEPEPGVARCALFQDREAVCVEGGTALEFNVDPGAGVERVAALQCLQGGGEQVGRERRVEEDDVPTQDGFADLAGGPRCGRLQFAGRCSDIISGRGGSRLFARACGGCPVDIIACACGGSRARGKLQERKGGLMPHGAVGGSEPLRVLPQHRRRVAVVVNQHGAARPPGQRLEAERAATGEEVEAVASLHLAGQPVEQRLPHPAERGAHRGAGGHLELSPFPQTADNAHFVS